MFPCSPVCPKHEQGHNKEISCNSPHTLLAVMLWQQKLKGLHSQIYSKCFILAHPSDVSGIYSPSSDI